MNENDLKIVISQNKYGYYLVDVYLCNKRIAGLTNSLSKFEIVYLVNRQEHLVLDVVNKEYKGAFYDVVVIRDTLGYANEYITLNLAYDIKAVLIALILQNKGDVL